MRKNRYCHQPLTNDPTSLVLIYRGVAQLGECVLWGHEAVSSSLTTPTIYYMYRPEEIIEFITRRFTTDCKWMTGNCYYFAIILQSRFPRLEIVYFPLPGHFMAYDAESDLFYDWTGCHNIDKDEAYYIWDELRNTEPLLYYRISDGCIV